MNNKPNQEQTRTCLCPKWHTSLKEMRTPIILGVRNSGKIFRLFKNCRKPSKIVSNIILLIINRHVKGRNINGHKNN